MSHFSNCLGDIYQIQLHIWSIFKHTTQYEVQSPQWHNHQAFYCSGLFLLNHTLIRVVSSIITESAFVLYLYLVQECHAAVTLLLSEACLL